RNSTVRRKATLITDYPGATRGNTGTPAWQQPMPDAMTGTCASAREETYTAFTSQAHVGRLLRRHARCTSAPPLSSANYSEHLEDAHRRESRHAAKLRSRKQNSRHHSRSSRGAGVRSASYWPAPGQGMGQSAAVNQLQFAAQGHAMGNARKDDALAGQHL